MKIYCWICLRAWKLNVGGPPAEATVFIKRTMYSSNTYVYPLCKDHADSRYTDVWSISREEYLTECLKEAL